MISAEMARLVAEPVLGGGTTAAHSAVTSVMADRAEDSSTMAFLAA